MNDWLRRGAGIFVFISMLAVGVPASAELSPADRETLSQVEAYLQAITTLQARFVQIGPNGELTRGDLYLNRPGRLRFQYDRPTPIVIVADGVWLVLVDRELEHIERWPVYDTPLGILVAEKVDFSHGVIVDRVSREAGNLAITMRYEKRADEGSLTLSFSLPALELRKWSVTDSQGGVTNVSISDVKTGVKLDPRLFFVGVENKVDEDSN